MLRMKFFQVGFTNKGTIQCDQSFLNSDSVHKVDLSEVGKAPEG